MGLHFYGIVFETNVSSVSVYKEARQFSSFTTVNSFLVSSVSGDYRVISLDQPAGDYLNVI